MGAFGTYQNEIYLGGLGDVVPELPADLTRLEAMAEERMPATAFGYVAGSAGSEATARANRGGFRRWRIVPRMLRDVATTRPPVDDLGTTTAGAAGAWRRSASKRSSTPTASWRSPAAAAAVGGADVRRHGRGHTLEDGRRKPAATRRAGSSSTGRTTPSSAELRRAGRGRRLRGDRRHARHAHARAGARATSKTPTCRSCGRWASPTTSPTRSSGARSTRRRRRTGRGAPAVGGDVRQPRADVGRPRLRCAQHRAADRRSRASCTPTTPARRADAGMDGIVVSNHGGRQVDGAIASLDALPAIADAVGGEIDGPVRQRRPHRLRRRQGAGARRRRGAARPPLRLGARRSGGADGVEKVSQRPRRARPDAGPLGSERPFRPDSRDAGPRLTARAGRPATSTVDSRRRLSAPLSSSLR